MVFEQQDNVTETKSEGLYNKSNAEKAYGTIYRTNAYLTSELVVIKASGWSQCLRLQLQQWMTKTMFISITR